MISVFYSIEWGDTRIVYGAIDIQRRLVYVYVTCKIGSTSGDDEVYTTWYIVF